MASESSTDKHGRRTNPGLGSESDSLVNPFVSEMGGESLDEQERLRYERDFWRDLFDQLVGELPEGVLVTDENGLLTHWNDKIATDLQISREEAIGRNAYDVISPDEQSEALSDEIVRRGEPIVEEDVREVPSTDCIFQVYGLPLRDPQGRVAGSFVVAPDVSEHVDRQRELERLQREVGTEVAERVEDVEATIDDVASFAEETETFAGEQTDRMNQIANEVSNLSAAVQEIAASANQVEVASEHAAEQATDGEAAAAAAAEAMRDVDDVTDDVTETVGKLKDQAEEVDQITAVINTIADRTNLLALNASIEAARAGEAGEGFAVVADEVKTLAEESQAESEKISDIVERIRGQSEETADQLDAMTDEVRRARKRVVQVTESLEYIVDAADETVDGTREIASATDEQAASSGEISAMLEEAVEELETMENRIETVASAADEGRKHARAVGTEISSLTE